MKNPELFRRQENGFTVISLANAYVAVEIVPQLGARLLSLRNRRTHEEWMWRPTDSRPLARHPLGLAFEHSTLAGADECLPTIDSCHWEGRELPDHGECWASAWTVDNAALADGRILTTLDLPRSPLHIERTVTLDGPRVHLAYRLTSRSDRPERWLWAFHPLYPLCPGDRLELPGNAVAPECAAGSCAKAFYSATEGRVALIRATGSRLTTTWSPAEIPWLAVWITRGYWHGHHHLALEPTVAPANTPDHPDVPLLAPGATVSWSFTLAVSPESPSPIF
jgi:galactose mutarotase-like enzyme